MKGASFFPPKSRYLFTKLYGVTSQYMVAFLLPSELEASHKSSDFLFVFNDWRSAIMYKKTDPF